MVLYSLSQTYEVSHNFIYQCVKSERTFWLLNKTSPLYLFVDLKKSDVVYCKVPPPGFCALWMWVRSLRSTFSPCAHGSALSTSADQTGLSESYNSHTTFLSFVRGDWQQGTKQVLFLISKGETESTRGFQLLLDITSSVAVVNMQVHIAGILMCGVSGELCFTLCFPHSFIQSEKAVWFRYI